MCDHDLIMIVVVGVGVVDGGSVVKRPLVVVAVIVQVAVVVVVAKSNESWQSRLTTQVRSNPYLSSLTKAFKQDRGRN